MSHFWEVAREISFWAQGHAQTLTRISITPFSMFILRSQILQSQIQGLCLIRYIQTIEYSRPRIYPWIWIPVKLKKEITSIIPLSQMFLLQISLKSAFWSKCRGINFCCIEQVKPASGISSIGKSHERFLMTNFETLTGVSQLKSSMNVCSQVLEMLEEVAFKPEFSRSRIEKERKAVLAEAQMMNTIEYRVDCALLKYLHYENALGSRFPIGKTDQASLIPSHALRNSRKYFQRNQFQLEWWFRLLLLKTPCMHDMMKNLPRIFLTESQLSRLASLSEGPL